MVDKPSNTQELPRSRTWLAIFQLCRFPALFSAWADILLAQGLVNGQVHFQLPNLGWLLLATSGLYLSGMAFNDIADRHVDRRERPFRPIPSGRVSLNLALRVAFSLLTLGLMAAWWAGPDTFKIALLIALAAQTYNFLLKGTRLGCFLMGLCRGLNLLMGASTHLTWPLNPSFPLGMALIYTLYVTGITWFARQESAQLIRRNELYTGIWMTTAARILWGLQILVRSFSPVAAIAVTLFTTISIRSVKKLLATALQPTPPTVQQGVRSLLLVIIPQHAILLLGLTGDFGGFLLIILLVVPAKRLSRLMAIT